MDKVQKHISFNHVSRFATMVMSAIHETWRPVKYAKFQERLCIVFEYYFPLLLRAPRELKSLVLYIP